MLGVVDYGSLTKEQKSKALRAINLIKEKRDGKIKGRCCSDGSGQRKYVPREEASSPTITRVEVNIIKAYSSKKNCSRVPDSTGNNLCV